MYHAYMTITNFDEWVHEKLLSFFFMVHDVFVVYLGVYVICDLP